MAVDREKILQAAQKHVDKKKYDRAIVEYQKLIAENPNDARTLLKIGDLQARMQAYPEAIATYDRVGQFYSSQGFALKAIAVYKQIRELIEKHVPALIDRYGHIVPKLAEIYAELGLTSDALAAYDEVAARLQRGGRDRDAIEIFRKMVTLDTTNPLPHLRLAEACCRVQSLDEAIESFGVAADLLIRVGRREDALKVLERILHFRQEPRFARLAAELYLDKGGLQDGLQALAKLQICFQADPRDLLTLELLARAFTAIGQAPKSIEVQKEMARIALEQGRRDLHDQLVRGLMVSAPGDDQVQALAKLAGMADAPPSTRARERMPSHRSALESTEYTEHDDISEVSAENILEEEPDTRTGVDPGRPFMGSAPDVSLDDRPSAARVFGSAVPEVNDIRAHTRRAIVDAESFRGLRLYSKATETLHIALELDPRSIELRERLVEVLAELGDREGTINEMIAIASIHIENGDSAAAEPILYQILEAEPAHPEATQLLTQMGAYVPANDETEVGTSLDDDSELLEGQFLEDSIDPLALEDDVDPGGAGNEVPTASGIITQENQRSFEEPLPSYDLEEMGAARAIVEDRGSMPARAALDSLSSPFDGGPFDGGLRGDSPLPSFDPIDAGLEPASGLMPSRPPTAEEREAIELALEEAEFFSSRGLHDDAKVILLDQWARSPNHPLVRERLAELGVNPEESGAREMIHLGETAEARLDKAFDIAASLEALDDVAGPSVPGAAAFSTASEQIDVDQVFAKFKEGVRAQVSESDSATHYDLGVAYKEMGLLQDAISEFELAARDATRECMCFAMIGMIELEIGQLDKAIDAYLRGLSARRKTVEQEMNLYYDLGVVYEMTGNKEEALYYFKKVARRDPGYRDVQERILALEPSQGKSSAPGKAINDDDEFDKAFDDMFKD